VFLKIVHLAFPKIFSLKNNDMQAVNKNQLFLASRIALIVTAITFAYRQPSKEPGELSLILLKNKLDGSSVLPFGVLLSP
jgi:hypothetical protein